MWPRLNKVGVLGVPEPDPASALPSRTSMHSQQHIPGGYEPVHVMFEAVLVAVVQGNIVLGQTCLRATRHCSGPGCMLLSMLLLLGIIGALPPMCQLHRKVQGCTLPALFCSKMKRIMAGQSRSLLRPPHSLDCCCDPTGQAPCHSSQCGCYRCGVAGLHWSCLQALQPMTGDAMLCVWCKGDLEKLFWPWVSFPSSVSNFSGRPSILPLSSVATTVC